VEIYVFNECASTISSAVDVFNRRWGHYSTELRTLRLLESVIEPAWRSYIQALPAGHRGRECFFDLSLSQIAKASGFDVLENLFRDRFRNYLADVGDTDDEFRSTIDTVREIAFCCSVKRSKLLSSGPGDGRRNRLYNEFCEFCGERTELAAFFRSEVRDGYDLEADECKARLSSKYCWMHRPKYLDGTRNPEYLSAARHQEEFRKELARLTRRSTSMRKTHLLKEIDYELDAFYLNILAPDAVYPDEKSRLRDEARELVDAHVDDRKKSMVMLHASGLSFAGIAEKYHLKSRQAVSKVLSSIPDKYRFDKNEKECISTADALVKREQQAMKSYRSSFCADTAASREIFFDSLVENVAAALSDNDVVEILLDPDGSLSIDTHTRGLLRIGTVGHTEARRIVDTVARIAGIEGNRIVQANLPFIPARFAGTLPPIEDKPSFVIRKMMPWPDTYSPKSINDTGSSN
jgi:hypothetical protein